MQRHVLGMARLGLARHGVEGRKGGDMRFSNPRTPVYLMVFGIVVLAAIVIILATA